MTIMTILTVIGYSVGTPSAPTLPTFTRLIYARPLSATILRVDRGQREHKGSFRGHPHNLKEISSNNHDNHNSSKRASAPAGRRSM